MASEQTVKKASNRGGRRPGAGRRPIAGKPLEAMVVARLTAEQKALYKKVGGTTWLRAVLNAGLSLDEVPDVAPSSIKEKARLRELPLFESGVQAGFPSPAEDYERKDIDLNKVLISNARATCVMRVRGESMNAAGIDDHDLILVDRSKIARIGDIVVMRVNNEFTVKRLMKDGEGKIYLHPESTSELYTDIYPDEFDEWENFGIVTYVIKKTTNR